LLVVAAWSYRHRACMTLEIQRRLDIPEDIIDRAWDA
jgi:hypothetical protein